MRRGVFAITWFFLLSSSLITVQTMYELLINNELKNQGTLMDSEEAFFIARNFEFDFRVSVIDDSLDEFFKYWKTRGNLTYGYVVDFPKKHCSQTKETFEKFMDLALIERDDVFLFSPIGVKQTCLTLEVNYKDFKTFGVIGSQRMYKQIVTLAFVLMIGFSCNSPFAVKFKEDRLSFPAGDPKLAAMMAPTVSDRFSYGVSKQICPGKTMKTVEKTMEFIVTQQFVKNVVTKMVPNPTTLLSVLPTLAATTSQIISDSLSPDALGYQGTKQAMQAAIGTAISSNYSCVSIEAASQIYHYYSQYDYVSDLCGKSDSLASILKILKKEKSKDTLEAVSIESEQKILPTFTDIYLRNHELGTKVKLGKLTREKALLELVSELKKLSVCHEISKDYFSLLETMAKENDFYFFEMFDAVKNFLENCPLEYSGYLLSSIENETLTFSNGFNDDVSINLSEEVSISEKNVTFGFSGPLPIKGEDVWFEDLQTKDVTEFENLKEEKLRELKTGYLVMIPLAGLVFWRMKKDEKN